MSWHWQVLIQGSGDETYDFRSTNGFKRRKKCLKSLHTFMNDGELFDILRHEGEQDPASLAVIDANVEWRVS